MNKMEQPLISVILPVYKVEQYLSECLDSLLTQTYHNFELILVNDGSPDDSWQIMQEYAKRDSRVRIFQKENGGVSSARNFGLEQAKGEYIGFVDPDDFAAPQYLEWMCRAMQDSNMDLAVCGYKRVRENEESTSPRMMKEEPQEKVFTLEEYSFDYTQCEAACTYVWRMLCKRSAVQGLHFDESLFIGEDTFFFFQVLLQAQKLVLVREPLYYYRIRSESACQRLFTEKHYTQVETWERIYELSKDLPPRMWMSAEQMLVLACSHAYYRMLEAHYPDEALRKAAVCKAREHKAAVKRMDIAPRWKLWDKMKIISMMYLPAGFNGFVWGQAEKLRRKAQKEP